MSTKLRILLSPRRNSSSFLNLLSGKCPFQQRTSLVNLRKYSSSAEDGNPIEVEIPVPWGHIAARHWRSSDLSRKPVLCIHGWKDNAATFDTLLPLLIPELPQYQFLAIDLPGHGRSSHFPPGMIYSVQDMWVLIRRILKFYDWKQISILSHSMGSQISFSYSGTHPQVVEKMVAIDALSPLVLSRDETILMIPKLTSDILKFEERLGTGTRPSYTFDEIVQKLLKTHVGGLSAESCKILMERGTELLPDGSYKFTHDIRVHYMPVTGFSSRQVNFIARNFRSDILHLKATKGINYTRPFIKTRMQEWLGHNADGTPKGNLVKFVDVEGGHHVHLTNPTSVLPHIVHFMNRHHHHQQHHHHHHDNF